ncbi:uncharacterized protein LOC109718525 [Ananas comosus]|uniref:Uncharacterized protein LOC109718525 n=1 Tax=Ananas comosus TaxID=4615 RepID=A0A199W8D1_ANACO|nr:uncharacterized protein LOC109718525 [Ananas comosus]OAY85478.1 hypothetical protein ACMD2_04098 [Ananas comosus]
MAMQVGMGLSRVILLVGAGVTGSIVLRNGRFSDILAELQDMVKGLEKSREKGGDSDSDVHEALASQVRRLASEVRQIASSRPITILNGNSGQTAVTALIVPAATLGALGYGYMWWKGLSFSDLMYVTKRNMANAVSGMTKHLEQVSAALAATKRHLTQRIENLDGKLDEQKVLSGTIKKEVTDARLQLENLGSELSNIQQLVWNMDGKMNALVAKQNCSLAGVMYLLQFAEGKGGKMPDALQDGLKSVGKRFVGCGETKSLKGLQHISEVDSEEIVKAFKETITQNDVDSDSLDNFKGGLSRTASLKC